MIETTKLEINFIILSLISINNSTFSSIHVYLYICLLCYCIMVTMRFKPIILYIKLLKLLTSNYPIMVTFVPNIHTPPQLKESICTQTSFFFISQIELKWDRKHTNFIMIMIKYIHSALVFHISYLNFHRLKKVMKSPTAASEFRCLLCFKCFCRKGGFQKKKKRGKSK